MVFNLTFSGAGFLGIYHVGVASCLKVHGEKLLKNVENFGGSSAGALTACMLICGVPFDDSVEFVMRLAKKAQSSILGPMSSGFDPADVIRKTCTKFLPYNAYQLASEKLHISLTRVEDWQNVVVSRFSCNKELVDALVCSSFIPFFSGIIPPKLKGVSYIDGGFTDNLPQHFQGETITVSPFTGESDICPKDTSKVNVHFDFKNVSVQITPDNMCRMARALFPPSPDVLVDMCKQGFYDTFSYLHLHFPYCLNLGIAMQGIPPCVCESWQSEGSTDEDSTSSCSCSSHPDDGEHRIAGQHAIRTVVVPRHFDSILHRTKELMSDVNVSVYMLKAAMQIAKWLAKPYCYTAGQCFRFTRSVLAWMLPKLKEYCSKSRLLSASVDVILSMLRTYDNAITFERHPSVKDEHIVQIQAVNRRILRAQESMVAVPLCDLNVNAVISSVTWEGRLGDEQERVESHAGIESGGSWYARCNAVADEASFPGRAQPCRLNLPMTDLDDGSEMTSFVGRPGHLVSGNTVWPGDDEEKPVDEQVDGA